MYWMGSSACSATVLDMHIDEAYQKCGIGTKIIEFAKEFSDEVIMVDGLGTSKATIHYTNGGSNFNQHCEGKVLIHNTSALDDEYDSDY